MISINRSLRQEQYWGEENQKKLNVSCAVILGNGILGQEVLGCMTGLGIGNILLMDNKRTYKGEPNLFMARSYYNNLKKTESLENIARQINDASRIDCVHSKFSKSVIDYYGYRPNIIIDTQNDPKLKEMSLEYALDKDIPYISAYSGKFCSIVDVFCGSNFKEIIDPVLIGKDDPQGPASSAVAAGIVVDEVRKKIFFVDENEKSLKKRIVYNIASEDRLSFGSNLSITNQGTNSKKFLVVGAGAIGNYLASTLALSGYKNIDIVDFDNIEDHNLARQILLYSRIGELKASVLHQRISEIAEVKGEAIIAKISSDSIGMIRKNGYDAIFGCLDNVVARYELSNIALDLGIPYIDGGTTPSSGIVACSVPGKTACVKCKKNLNPEIKQTRNNSCAVALPSVVSPNIIIGGLMVGEFINYLHRDTIDMGFNSFNPERIYSKRESYSKGGCNCQSLTKKKA